MKRERKRRSGKPHVLALVQATQTVLMDLDDPATFPEDIVLQRHIDRFYSVADDDRKIGGPHRRALAELLRELRQDERFRAAFKRAVQDSMKQMQHNPQRWGLYDKPLPRLHSTKVHRKATSPKTHPDCAYCGYGGDGIRICGRCKAEGIDGLMIPGTGARGATTYQIWR